MASVVRALRYFDEPLSGSLVRYNDDYGVMLVDANETEVTFKFFNVAREVVDFFTIGTVRAP